MSPTVTLISDDLHGRMGVARAAGAMAGAVSDRAQVRVLSQRLRAQADYPLPHGLEVEPLREPRARLTGSEVLVATDPALARLALSWGRRRASVVLWEHVTYQERFGEPAGAALMREVLPEVAALVVQNPTDERIYRRMFPGVRVTTIPNVLSWERAGEPAPASSTTIALVGRHARLHHYPTFVAAFRRLASDFPEWRVRICGAGPRMPGLERQVELLGLGDRVEVLGQVDELRPVLAGAAVLAKCSTSESFGLPILEAMSLGVPAVAYDAPSGPRALIRDGENGMLVDNGEIDVLMDRLRLLMDDPDTRVRLGARALADSAAYTPDRVGDLWQTCWEAL